MDSLGHVLDNALAGCNASCRCVAIHKKPGYDPAEMLWRFRAPFGLLWFIFKIILSVLFRVKTLVDASPLDCRSIRGSHGGLPDSDAYRPVLITKHDGGGTAAGARVPRGKQVQRLAAARLCTQLRYGATGGPGGSQRGIS